jgi:hypothetical protein
MFPCQLIASIYCFFMSCIDSNGMEEDAVPKDVRAEDSVADEPSVSDNKQNSDDEEESGKTGFAVTILIIFNCFVFILC